MAIQKLDNLDKQILRMIAEDARVPFLEVARACDVSALPFTSAFRSSPAWGYSKVHSLSSIQKR